MSLRAIRLELTRPNRQACKELPKRNLQRAGDCKQRRQAGVAFAPLEEANVVAMQPGALGQLLLAQIAQKTMPSDFAARSEKIGIVDHVGRLASGAATRYILPVCINRGLVLDSLVLAAHNWDDRDWRGPVSLGMKRNRRSTDDEQDGETRIERSFRRIPDGSRRCGNLDA